MIKNVKKYCVIAVLKMPVIDDLNGEENVELKK